MDEDDEDMNDEGDEIGNKDASAEYDPFAAESFDDPDMQNCWLILGKLYYDYWATDFLDPVTVDTFGDD